MKSTDPKPKHALDDVLTYRIKMLEVLLNRVAGSSYTDTFALSTDQWRILAAITVWGPVEASRISRWATVDKAAVSRSVSALVKKRFLTRSSHAEDGRKQVLGITATGKKTFEQVVTQIHTIQRELFEGYTTQEQTQFFRMLNTIEERLRVMLETDPR